MTIILWFCFPETLDMKPVYTEEELQQFEAELRKKEEELRTKKKKLHQEQELLQERGRALEAQRKEYQQVRTHTQIPEPLARIHHQRASAARYPQWVQAPPRLNLCDWLISRPCLRCLRGRGSSRQRPGSPRRVLMESWSSSRRRNKWKTKVTNQRAGTHMVVCRSLFLLNKFFLFVTEVKPPAQAQNNLPAEPLQTLPIHTWSHTHSQVVQIVLCSFLWSTLD